MKRERIFEQKIKIAALLLIGILLGMMTAMMYLGGSVSFGDFLQTGRVCDFSQEMLSRSSGAWIYDAESSSFQITAKKAFKKFVLDKKENCWNDLILHVEKMSLPQWNMTLCYYNKAGERIYEQPILLQQGDNFISLNGEMPVYRLGFYVKNMEGESISFTSMQVREKLVARNMPMAIAVAGMTFLTYVLLCCALILYRQKTRRNITGNRVKLPEFADVFENAEHETWKPWKRKNIQEKRCWRRLAFSLLFFWCIAGNVLGWTADKELYRQHVLICSLLLILAGVTCAEKEERRPNWKTPVMYVWVLLWLGMVAQIFFVKTSIQYHGYAMLLAGIFFLYHWVRMQHPEFVLWDMLAALEIIFFISIICCLLFRPKLPAVQYNGVFKNPEENAMFAVLMLAVFGIEMVHGVQKELRGTKMFFCIFGGLLSAYMIVRTETKAGILAAALIMLIFVWSVFQNWKRWSEWLIAKRVRIFVMSLFCVLLVAGFHIGIKKLPYVADMVCVYENEIKQSNKSQQLLNELEMLIPGSTEGVIQTEKIETALIQKNYVRYLNLWGNAEELKVFGEKRLPYNSYLYMAYRYGIFILVPYILYQICMLFVGVEYARKAKHCRDCGESVRNSRLWILCITTITIVFCFMGNCENFLGHPLWICFYLGVGFCLAVGGTATCEPKNGEKGGRKKR